MNRAGTQPCSGRMRTLWRFAMEEHDVWVPPGAPAMSSDRQMARREQVMTMIQQDQTSNAPVVAQAAPKRRRGFLIVPLATGAAAAVAVAGVLLTGVTSGNSPAPDTAGHATEAAQVLQLAAASAADKPALRARPDQFVFIETTTAYGETIVEDGKVTQKPATPMTRQIWLSVDGTRDGLLRQEPKHRSQPGDPESLPLPGCRNGHGVENGGRPCQPQPAVRTDLPTTPDAMFSWLYENSDGGNPRNVQAFITVGDLIRETYLPPATLSALFSAASRIPGVTVDKDAQDASGRRGIGVKMPAGGAELVFDPQTYEYLGERSHGVANEVNGAARIRLAIVDKAGQLP
ncbi:CU044_5270 family protein [Micromonospora chersina]|uniref:CU044_5270 family protein n=1 Tax=Micromonospora chersina TaxID=47854 RepID=UPI00372264E1